MIFVGENLIVGGLSVVVVYVLFLDLKIKVMLRFEVWCVYWIGVVWDLIYVI